MTVAGREVREGHLERAADFRVHVMDVAGKAVRRQPFCHRIGIEERAIDLVGSGTEHAVEFDGSGWHGWFLLAIFYADESILGIGEIELDCFFTKFSGRL